MAPKTKPENSSGLSMLTESILVRVTKAPNSARATRHADPIAKPFPMAAVVFPAASSTSVRYRATAPASDISTIPPALSAIGPYPSIVSAVVRVQSIPSAANDIPYMFPRPKETKIATARQTAGINVERKPRARPLMMLGAAPDLAAFATF